MATDPTATAARPCSSCGRPRAECRTPVDLFLSCCHTCAENDGDTHREPATAATESWDDVPVRDCYTKVQGQPCGLRHGWASWLTTLYVCPGTEATDQPATAALRVLGIEDLRHAVYEPYWLWCRRHQQSVPPGFKCRREDRTGYHSTDECVRIGPFMSEREASRLTGNQPAGYGAWALGMEVE